MSSVNFGEDPFYGCNIERTPLFHFLDMIDVRFWPTGHGLQTLDLYSRLLLGNNDLGQNRKCIVRWLAGLKQDRGM